MKESPHSEKGTQCSNSTHLQAKPHIERKKPRHQNTSSLFPGSSNTLSEENPQNSELPLHATFVLLTAPPLFLGSSGHWRPSDDATSPLWRFFVSPARVPMPALLAPEVILVILVVVHFHFSSFSFIFFHFLTFSIIFCHFSFPFIFFQFPVILFHFHSFSFIFIHFLSFSDIFFHVL